LSAVPFDISGKEIMAAKRAAYSLAETIAVVLILGALAFIAIPQLNLSGLHHKQAYTIAKKIATDLRRARTLAISKAVNNSAGYGLQMVGSSPYTSYKIIDSNSAATVVDTLTIDSPISCTGGSLFKFGPLGNLLSGSSTTPITVSADGITYTITVISATGIVECAGG
jgi:Tfp pilus assembly protein FimT